MRWLTSRGSRRELDVLERRRVDSPSRQPSQSVPSLLSAAARSSSIVRRYPLKSPSRTNLQSSAVSAASCPSWSLSSCPFPSAEARPEVAWANPSSLLGLLPRKERSFSLSRRRSFPFCHSEMVPLLRAGRHQEAASGSPCRQAPATLCAGRTAAAVRV